MSIISSLKFITAHPLNRSRKIKSIARFIKWQISTRINPYPVIYQFTEKAKLIVGKGMTGATGNLYCGLHEYHDMSFLIHFLTPADSFADIGANVGSYTVLASGHVGAKSYSFEPIPATFSTLQQNIAVNAMEGKVQAFNVALGSSKGTIGFKTTSLDAMNHVAENSAEIDMYVPIETLDEIMSEKPTPILLKIDVEGFETEVIGGAAKTLNDSALKAIIIEINGSGLKYGYNDMEIHKTLLDLNFRSYLYNPERRELNSIDKPGEFNTIYVRDLEFVSQRVKQAPLLKIFDKEI